MTNRIKQLGKDLFFVLCLVNTLALLDAYIGSIISHIVFMVRDNYGLIPAQVAVDSYQFLFGAFCLLTLYAVSMTTGEWYRALATLLLLAAYAEDLLYYVWQFLTVKVIAELSHGTVIIEPGFPERISGWWGWLFRRFGDHFEGLTPATALVLAISFAVLAIWVLWQNSNLIKR